MTASSPETPRARRKPAATGYLSYALGASIPMVMGLFWFAYHRQPTITPQATRPLVCLIALISASLFAGLRISKAEIKLAAVLGFVCLIYLVTAFAAVDVERAFEGWIKQITLCLVALFMGRALRNRSVAKGFGHGMLLASLLISAGILLTYIRILGFSLPTYAATRRFKGVVEHMGMPLNPISFTAVMAYMTAMCLVRPTKLFWAVGGGLFCLCSFFTGSRAPLTILFATLLVLFIINGLRSGRTLNRFAASILLVAVLVGLPLALTQLPFRTVSFATEGRWDFWYVAIEKFTERPLLGYGFESSHDDLLARTPGVYVYRGSKTQGGYHNIYLTVLAEEGLIGFSALLALSWFLLQSSWHLAFRQWRTWHNNQWALAAALFLLIRACIESSGLLGYLNGPSDYIAYLLLAIVASRFSIEETYARALLGEYRSSNPATARTAPHFPFANPRPSAAI